MRPRASATAKRARCLGDHALFGWNYVPELDANIAVVSNATNPGDVWQLRDGVTNQLTNVYDFVAENYWLPRQEAITWQGADGESVEGEESGSSEGAAADHGFS